MNQDNQWNHLLEFLFTCAEENCLTEHERAYQEQRNEQFEDLLHNHLLEDQRQMVDGMLYELDSDAEHESRLLYRQGMCDCVWLLKNLGVLA